MDMYETLKVAVQVSLYLVALKALMGLHFPWEKCQCCGHRYDEHEKNTPSFETEALRE